MAWQTSPKILHGSWHAADNDGSWRAADNDQLPHPPIQSPIHSIAAQAPRHTRGCMHAPIAKSAYATTSSSPISATSACDRLCSFPFQLFEANVCACVRARLGHAAAPFASGRRWRQQQHPLPPLRPAPPGHAPATVTAAVAGTSSSFSLQNRPTPLALPSI